MLNQRSFTVKIYDKLDPATYVTTLNPNVIKNSLTFSASINGGLGQCELDLNLPMDDFGEGTSIDYMNIVKIYVSTPSNTAGVLVYQGFISRYTPYIQNSTQGVKVTLLGLVSLLSFAYAGGLAAAWSYTTRDPAYVMNRLVNDFDGEYPGISTHSYNAVSLPEDSIQNVGTTPSFEFSSKKWNEAIDYVLTTTGEEGWWWFLGADGVFQFKPKPSTPTHYFTLGKDVKEFYAEKTAEKIVNKARLGYDTHAEFYDDATSIADYGLREYDYSDPEATDATLAENRVTQYVNENKDPKVKVRLSIMPSYDLESIKIGDTCSIRNVKKDAPTFNENMVIAGLTYTLDGVTLQLEEIGGNLGRELTSLIQ